MGFIVFLVFMWILVSAIRSAAKKQQAQATHQLPPDWFGLAQLPADHVRHVGAAPTAALARRAATEESSSELIADETLTDHELNLDHADVVSLEVLHERAVAPRALPGAAASLETEVDWETEHQRFHKRYVDARPAGRPAAHGLLDDLRDPAQARRAVLMAEILGPPVSMRR
jgi:hypothetical protein